jgi:hypothetical protein
MRIPVYRRGADPRLEVPLMRKSRFYAEQQVREGLADWVDYGDPRKGIICREMLRFGPREMPVVISRSLQILPASEVHGTKYVGPQRGPLYAGLLVRARLWAKALQSA